MNNREALELREIRAKTVQAIVVSLSILGGGIWTAWTFHNLHTKEQASLDREASNNAVRLAWAIDLKIEVSESNWIKYGKPDLGQKDKEIFGLNISVEIDNRGHYFHEFDVEKSLTIWRVSTVPSPGEAAKVQGYGREVVKAYRALVSPVGTEFQGEIVKSVEVHPSSTFTLRYLYCPDDNRKGDVFFVSFQMPPSKKMSENRQEVGGNVDGESQRRLSASRFYFREHKVLNDEA